MTTRPNLTTRQIEKFWSLVDIRGEDECWPWQRKFAKGGYGTFTVNHIPCAAHRIAFFLTYGFWPEIGRHTCDNPQCCNPRHILDGTTLDNVRDRVERGRSSDRKGSNCPTAKLTDSDVSSIKKMIGTKSNRKIAKHFNISPTMVNRIANGTAWTNVT